MSTLRDQSNKVYTRYGRVHHLLFSITFATGREISDVLCGMYAWDRSAWLGTGSQKEYEKAAALPPCARCYGWLKQDEDREQWQQVADANMEGLGE